MAIDPFKNMNSEQAEAYREFLIARGEALAKFGAAEQGIYRLFTYLTGMAPFEAGVVFFKINNVRSIKGMMEKIKRHKLGSRENLFFNSLLRLYEQVSGYRNAMVHGSPHLNVSYDDNEVATCEYTIAIPNFWEYVQMRSSAITLSDLDVHMSECTAVYTAASALHQHWQGAIVPSPLLEVLQLAIPYPIPVGHPLRADG